MRGQGGLSEQDLQRLLRDASGVGISSTRQITHFWGIAGGAASHPLTSEGRTPK